MERDQPRSEDQKIKPFVWTGFKSKIDRVPYGGTPQKQTDDDEDGRMRSILRH